MVGQDEEQTKKTHGHDLANQPISQNVSFFGNFGRYPKKISICELQLFTNIKVIHS